MVAAAADVDGSLIFRNRLVGLSSACCWSTLDLLFVGGPSVRVDGKEPSQGSRRLSDEVLMADDDDDDARLGAGTRVALQDGPTGQTRVCWRMVRSTCRNSETGRRRR